MTAANGTFYRPVSQTDNETNIFQRHVPSSKTERTADEAAKGTCTTKQSAPANQGNS